MSVENTRGTEAREHVLCETHGQTQRSYLINFFFSYGTTCGSSDEAAEVGVSVPFPDWLRSGTIPWWCAQPTSQSAAASPSVARSN